MFIFVALLNERLMPSVLCWLLFVVLAAVVVGVVAAVSGLIS